MTKLIVNGSVLQHLLQSEEEADNKVYKEKKQNKKKVKKFKYKKDE